MSHEYQQSETSCILRDRFRFRCRFTHIQVGLLTAGGPAAAYNDQILHSAVANAASFASIVQHVTACLQLHWPQHSTGSCRKTLNNKQTCSAAGVADLQCCLRCSASSLDLRMPEYWRVTLAPRDACWKSTVACTKPRAAQHLLSSEATCLQHSNSQAMIVDTYVDGIAIHVCTSDVL